MKLIAFAMAAAVQSAFTAPGNVPATGKRYRFMTLDTNKDNGNVGGLAYGANYGMSGDLVSGPMWTLKASSKDTNSAEENVFLNQANNPDTWFYYQSPLNDRWYKTIYMPFSEPASFSQIGSADGSSKTIDGTTVYGLYPCNNAIVALYEAEEEGVAEAEKVKLEEDCEKKCVAFTVATDFTDAKDCTDPKGSLPLGRKGSDHPWLEPLYQLAADIQAKIDSGEEVPDESYDFTPPHVVGSKVLNGEEQNVDTQQVADDIAALEEHNKIDDVIGNVHVPVGDEVTDAPTTAAPTTAEPSTAAPTTAAPTTAAPTVTEDDEESGVLINSLSLVLLVAMANFQ